MTLNIVFQEKVSDVSNFANFLSYFCSFVDLSEKQTSKFIPKKVSVIALITSPIAKSFFRKF